MQNIYSFIISEDCFKRPRLLKSMKAFLDNVSVTLYPNIEKFEDELLSLLNEDRLNRDNTVADGSCVTISERRLMVCTIYVVGVTGSCDIMLSL